VVLHHVVENVFWVPHHVIVNLTECVLVPCDVIVNLTECVLVLHHVVENVFWVPHHVIVNLTECVLVLHYVEVIFENMYWYLNCKSE
jgi:hypothetical protein